MTALVVSGHTRAALAAVRSLGRAGIAVAVAAPVRPALAMWSRYATATLLVPDATRSARGFADAVAEEVVGRRCCVVLAATDAELWALSRWREQLPKSTWRVLPPHDAVARCLDRATLHDLATSLGVPCLETFRVDSQASIEPAIRRAQRMGMPAVIRPLVSWEEREDGTRREAERIGVRDVAELRRTLYEREDLVEAGCLIEPRPEGRSLSYCAVCDGGVPVVELFGERIREQTLTSGVSTLSRTIEPHTAARELSRRLLRALSWQGPAVVELLELPDGSLKLVTIIARMWGSVQLAIDAGIDVPLLCYRIAEGSPLPPVPHVARPGVTLRWVVGDMQQVIGRLTRGRGAAGQGFGLLPRVKALAAFASPRGALRTHGDVFDVEDPMPFVFEVQAAAKGGRTPTE